MALGASRENVVLMVVYQGMKFVLTGVALGLLASFGFARVMTGFLYCIKPTDTLTFAVTPLLLCLVALAANLAPALRAPASGLREESRLGGLPPCLKTGSVSRPGCRTKPN
jgi:hypothetical protein